MEFDWSHLIVSHNTVGAYAEHVGIGGDGNFMNLRTCAMSLGRDCCVDKAGGLVARRTCGSAPTLLCYGAASFRIFDTLYPDSACNDHNDPDHQLQFRKRAYCRTWSMSHGTCPMFYALVEM